MGIDEEVQVTVSGDRAAPGRSPGLLVGSRTHLHFSQVFPAHPTLLYPHRKKNAALKESMG